MLRHYDQHGGGVKVYTHQILQALLALKSGHEFVFLYANPALLGTYAAHPEVREVAVPGRSVVLWDQLQVPRAIRRLGVDVLYNPKYSIPLAAQCPTSWVCHGLDWYVMPQASRWIDRMSHRHLVPRYARKARAIIAVSEITRQHVMEFLGVAPDRVHTIYSGVNPMFARRLAPAELAATRAAHRLPERFFLYAGAVYPPKNFARMVQAYARVGPPRGISLVIAGGENRFLSEDELREPERLGLGSWVHWAGWIDPAQLPAFYQLAEALLLPSLFESLGLPVLEAMSSSCPVVTSDCYGTKEIAEGAAVLVEPKSVDAIAAGIASIADDAQLRTRLIEAGLERAREFTWERCARQTLGVIERISGER